MPNIDWSKPIILPKEDKLLFGTDAKKKPVTEEKKEEEDELLIDDIKPIEVEMLVPSQHFMNAFEMLNDPQPKASDSESNYFDCNSSKRENVDESLAFDFKKKVETFDANENAK